MESIFKFTNKFCITNFSLSSSSFFLYFINDKVQLDCLYFRVLNKVDAIFAFL